MTLDQALRSAVVATATRIAAEVSRSGMRARVDASGEQVAVLVEDPEAMQREYGGEAWVFPALGRALAGGVG